MKLKRINNADGSLYGYRFECPGCKDPHPVPTTGSHAWGFNGNTERPTLTPSILVHESRCDDGTIGVIRCHSYVTDGRIQFLGDCGHALAGQTVELPEVSP